MQKHTGRFLVVLFALWAWLAQAQAPLTNADIAAMLKAGVPEDSIIFAIRTAGQNGTAQFDNGSAALVQLKNQGASRRVLIAMLETPVNPAPGLPSEAGAYYRAPSGWQRLPSTELWPPYYSKSLSISNYEVKMPVPEPRVRIADCLPSFYIREFPAATQWSLVRLGEKHELHAKVDNAMRPQVHIDPAQLRPVAVQPVATDIVALKPEAQLEPGDYALCSVVPGSRDLLVCRPFRIAP